MSLIEIAGSVYRAISERNRKPARSDLHALDGHEISDIGIRPYLLAGLNHPTRKIEPYSPPSSADWHSPVEEFLVPRV
jgi:hypothetical protein